MRLRESGMPEEVYWESLFDVDLILNRLEIDERLKDVIELGCGYGTFTVPTAKRIGGTLNTCDVDQRMVERTQHRCAEAGVGSVICGVRDVASDGFGVAPSSQDGCLLFNVLHCENPIEILAESARRVRAGGKVFVIHWCHDPATPRGPSLSIRPRPDQILTWAQATGALQRDSMVLELPPWHWGLRIRKVAK